MYICTPGVCMVPTEARMNTLDVDLWVLVSYHIGSGSK